MTLLAKSTSNSKKKKAWDNQSLLSWAGLPFPLCWYLSPLEFRWRWQCVSRFQNWIGVKLFYLKETIILLPFLNYFRIACPFLFRMLQPLLFIVSASPTLLENLIKMTKMIPSSFSPFSRRGTRGFLFSILYSVNTTLPIYWMIFPCYLHKCCLCCQPQTFPNHKI